MELAKRINLLKIVAATVLCGKFSLATAVISGGEWVSSHEQRGRNK